MDLPIYQIDAFSNEKFKGNPAAVCPLTEWLPDATMQNIAQENNLAETAFFLPKENDFELRWFTPAVEVDLCGHATLASAHVLFKHLNYPNQKIVFHTRSGPLIVERKGEAYQMDFPADIVQAVKPSEYLIKGLNQPFIACFKGKDDLMVVFDSQEEIENLEPDFKTLMRLEARGVICTAPGSSVNFVSRFFAPQCGIDEDPVTGSAHTTLTPYWAGQLGKKLLSARQLSARGGDLKCELVGDRVLLTGAAVTYMVGRISI